MITKQIEFSLYMWRAIVKLYSIAVLKASEHLCGLDVDFLWPKSSKFLICFTPIYKILRGHNFVSRR